MDILNEMTKAEIIQWIRGSAAYIIKPPRKSQLLFARWMIQSKKISDKRKAHIARGELLDMSKRDRYAREFNRTQDADKKLLLLKKIAPYEKKWQAYLSESKAIMAEDKRVDKLYTQIEVERQKEIS